MFRIQTSQLLDILYQQNLRKLNRSIITDIIEREIFTDYYKLKNKMLNHFIRLVKSNPKAIAIIVKEQSYTYLELFNAANSIAISIENNNTRKNGLIGLYIENDFYTYAGILGVLFSGNAFVPLNSKFPNDKLTKIIHQTDLQLILANQQSEEKVRSLSEDLLVIQLDQKLVHDEFEPISIDLEQFVYILFTSGSTGEPKGIPISNKNFSNFLDALMRKYPLTTGNKVLQCFELSFDVSIACTFLAFSSGATLVVSDVSGIIAVNAFKSIIDYQVDFVVIAPSAITYLVNYKLIPQFSIPFVKTTLFTGEALSFERAEKWKESAVNTVIDNAYGPTEVTVWSYFYRLDNNTSHELLNGLCPIGKPLLGVESKLLNPENEFDEGYGELLLTGKHVFKKYWKNDKKTNEVFINDDENINWYRTGDLVYENKFGNIVYINRIDNQVKINGYRIELGEIEFAIKKLLLNAQVVVVAGKDEKGNQQLVAFIDKEFDERLLLTQLPEVLNFYMVPKKYVLIKDIPLNANGKVDRNKLKLKANENRN